MKLQKNDIGKSCQVEWDDVGQNTCILLNLEGKEAQVYNFTDKHTYSVEKTQVKSLNDYITPNGLKPSLTS